MLRTIIISPDVELAQRLEQAIDGLNGEVSVCRTLDRYPAVLDLVRTLRAHAPEAVFLSFQDVARASEVVKFLETEASGLQIIAIHHVCDAPLLRETMRAGVREFLSDPFDPHSLADALGNIKGLLERKPPVYDSTDQVLAFLPSKAGVGTTTLALNMSAALARRKNTHVLLVDLDLNSGMLRFLLKLTNAYSMVDAVEHSLHMDEALWPQLVTSKGNLDILHAGRLNPNLRVEPTQIRNLLQFMRRNYDAVCVDLSGNLERYSLEVMQEAKRVILVCTPEIPSLHLAREKLGFLRNLGIEKQVSLVLNRVPRKSLLSKQHVEDVLGLKVDASFTNDYYAISRATTAGSMLEPDTTIAKQCAEFVSQLLDRRPQTPGNGNNGKRFLQYFAVSNQMAKIGD